MPNAIHVFSEIGRLKQVMLHRPGRELENLVPDHLNRLLFDDIPFLEQARAEHDRFAEVLRQNDVEVLYLEDLAAESLTSPEIKQQFLKDYLAETTIQSSEIIKEVTDYFMSCDNDRELIDKTMAGLAKNELELPNTQSLAGTVDDQYPFLIDPMPNLYFTRDPFATIGNGVSLNRMYSETRRRETLYGKYIFAHHPMFQQNPPHMLYDRAQPTRIEGGDELVLSKHVLAIGISQRTDAASIEQLARKVFENEPSFEYVLAFDIGQERKFMHLDTVFTMVDYDKFTIHPAIEASLKVTNLSYDKTKDEIIAIEEEDSLEAILSKYLGRDITLIRCGNGDQIISGREQWNDGSNTLAISPGKVITYDRNYVTNELLDKHNIEVFSIASSELSRGRGGPRCMSMPFIREELKY